MKECPYDLRDLWHLTGMGEKELKVYRLGKGFVLQPSSQRRSVEGVAMASKSCVIEFQAASCFAAHKRELLTELELASPVLGFHTIDCELS